MKPDITTWQLDGSVHPEKVSQNVVIGQFLTLKNFIKNASQINIYEEINIINIPYLPVINNRQIINKRN